MSTKRVPDIRPKRSYCRRSWSPSQRIAHYSKRDPLTGCHIWQGGPLKPRGYGRLKHQGRMWLAHRLAWTLKNGPIPKGMILCHRCNVRRCVNPDHLVLGTCADNSADIKAARIRLADAREATRGDPASDRGAMAIRIFVGGVEMRGRVMIDAANDGESDPRKRTIT
jgi:HNH endonuclease